MSNLRKPTIVAVALTHTAEVRAWKANVTEEREAVIRRTLRNLLDLGHVASFSVRADDDCESDDVVAEFRTLLGGFVVDACSTAPEPRDDVPPAFLMPVWSFNHLVEGLPSASGRLLGLELELIATPSPDEELGTCLPGHVGRWLILARTHT
jgi:hypothetical protein